MMTKYSFILYMLIVGCGTIAAQNPENIYINQYKRKKTITAIKGAYMQDLGIQKGLIYLYDSLTVKIADGEILKYRLAEIDSVSFEEPRDLLIQELEYYNRTTSKRFPTYADDYSTTNCSWNNYRNWNLANVHDPSIVKAADGYYYMYQTDASYGNAHASSGGHFIARRSKDLVNWTVLGPAMKGDVPTWVSDSCNAIRARMGLPLLGSTADNAPAYGYWAPVVRRIKDDLYRMYYCVVMLNYIKTGNNSERSAFDGSWTERAFIGLMETSNPATNKWTDKGYVLCSSTDKTMGSYSRGSTNEWNTAYFRWNAIDPTYEITPEGEHWLIYGSWHSGLCAIQLDGETGKLQQWPGESWKIGTGSTSTYGKRVATRQLGNRWQGSEGPEVIYNPETGYYYLFMAYDELSVAYNTRVARSKSIDGPYYGMDGTNITNGGECYPVVTHPYKFSPANSTQTISGWVGFSHCAVFNDGQGNWFYSSQARLPKGYNNNEYSNAVMMGHIRSIRWTEDGWPVVMPERYAAVPQPSIIPEELTGKWENIDLGYTYATQRTSTGLTLNADGSMTGSFTGQWNYEPQTQILKLICTGGAFKGTLSLCVQRELDWEANPRKATIVYAGYSSNGKKTFWGKKVE